MFEAFRVPSIHGLQSLLTAARADLAQGLKVQVAGVSETLAQLTVLGLAADANIRRIVVVLPTPKALPAWTQFVDYALARSPIGRQGAVLPYYSSYGNDRFINPNLARRQRLFALSILGSTTPSLVVTTAPALGQRTLTPSALEAANLRLKPGDEHDQDVLIAKLEDMGYLPAQTIEEEGTYAVRGGILDVFPVNRDDPVRIELIGDSVVSIRSFAVGDQKSKTTLTGALIAPAYEAITPVSSRKDDAQALFNTLLEQGVVAADRDGMLAQFQQGLKFAGFDMFLPIFRAESGSGLDHLGADTVVIFPEGEEPCIEHYKTHYEAIVGDCRKDLERQRPALPPPSHFETPEMLAARLVALPRIIEFGNPYASGSTRLYRMEARAVIDGAPQSGSFGAELFDKWTLVIESVLKKEGAAVAIFAHHEEQIERIANLLGHRGLKPTIDPDLLAKLGRGELGFGGLGGVFIGRGDLVSHAWLDDASVLIIPEQVLFGSRPRKVKPASQKLQNYLSSFADLKVSDLIVHAQHGIGRYRGLTTLTVAGITSDFLILEYSGNDKIYLPVDRLSLLQRYSAGSETSDVHALDRLGGGAWEKRKGKVKGAVRDMADELLKLNARRAVARGIAFGPADDTFLKFEASFPYEETEDQLRAIHDVEADLRSGKPMDRLVCGDVGFGKTEVAIRAAMRTVLEGHQVLVLVPTTVLCYQHYRTFRDRLERYGVRVAQVNRFVKPDDMKAATEGLKSGAVDILIGTHRILSKDIAPRRLGLLVVDEEQRFGVTHKEKLKELKAGAHVLTLTATPIPRTLHMSMVGLRDISIIATPPHDRLSVKTYISRFDQVLIRDAIEQEVRRGGQVFFVHNRVEDIEEMRLFIKTLVPGAEVRIGHGQMKEHQLEAVIVDFLEQKFPILLCTTIIESGVDMPTVNTLIVTRADRFGLAQLYQLRGRVGRSHLQAYAYFLTPAEERLTDDGKKRLDVLAAHQELGAGFQIASHDLELRGSGNLLGGQQSGHAAAVGLELYTELLEAAIHELRGEPAKERIDTEIKIPVSAIIPPEYVPGETQRLHLYKSLFAADSEEVLRSLRQELVDRFGPMPAECALLFKVARLKQQLRDLGALRLTAGKGVFEIRFSVLPTSQAEHLMKVVARQPKRYKLAPDNRLLMFHEVPERPNLAEQDAMLAALSALVDPLAEGGI